jgi:hypothetical protein
VCADECVFAHVTLVRAQVSGGGDCLVFMATDASLAGRSGVYYNNDLDGKGEEGTHRRVCLRVC